MDEECATSHRIKWGPLPPTEVGRTAQHIREGEGLKERRKGRGIIIVRMLCFYNFVSESVYTVSTIVLAC